MKSIQQLQAEQLAARRLLAEKSKALAVATAARDEAAEDVGAAARRSAEADDAVNRARGAGLPSPPPGRDVAFEDAKAKLDDAIRGESEST